MKKVVIGILATVIVFAGVITCQAQGGRVDTVTMRQRVRARQRAIEDPANNPVKIEPYEPLKPPPPEATPLRATIELQVVGVKG